MTQFPTYSRVDPRLNENELRTMVNKIMHIVDSPNHGDSRKIKEIENIIYSDSYHEFKTQFKFDDPKLYNQNYGKEQK